MTFDALLGAMGIAFMFPTYARVMAKVTFVAKLVTLLAEMVL